MEQTPIKDRPSEKSLSHTCQPTHFRRPGQSHFLMPKRVLSHFLMAMSHFLTESPTFSWILSHFLVLIGWQLCSLDSIFRPPRRGQSLYSGQNGWSQCVLYSAVPLYIRKRTTSLQWTKWLVSMCPLFRGSAAFITLTLKVVSASWSVSLNLSLSCVSETSMAGSYQLLLGFKKNDAAISAPPINNCSNTSPTHPR